MRETKWNAYDAIIQSMTELKKLENEKKKVRFDRLESPRRNPFFDPLQPMFGTQPTLLEPLQYNLQ